MSEFQKYVGHFLYTLEDDPHHLYRAISSRYEHLLNVARDSKFYVPFEPTSHVISVGGNSCQVIRLPKIPFQIRIQETTRAYAMKMVMFLVDFAIDCHERFSQTPSDIHEGNILWWDRPYFVDYDALRPLTHPAAALTFVRIGHLFYKYACGRRYMGSHDSFNFEALGREGGWMGDQIGRKDFTDPGLWRALRGVLQNFQPSPAKPSHWSEEYAGDLTALAKNPKFVQVLDLAPPGETMIDVGCNKGYTCHLLSDRYEKVMGFDSDEACIDAAETVPGRNFACFGLEHLALHEPIPIQERFHADVVMALAVTHHFDSLGLSVPFVSDILSGLTKQHLLMEDIAHVAAYHRELKTHGLEIVEHVPSHPSGRMLTLWRKK